MKTKSLITLVVLALSGCSRARSGHAPAATAIQWEHGWKTAYVVATRYRNPSLGYNIGFTFPGHENCDRAELVAFVEASGGHVYQCGGYPGAEMFAVFKDVTDRQSADKKLPLLLPEFDKIVRAL